MIEVRPVSPKIGAEIIGVDVRELDPSAWPVCKGSLGDPGGTRQRWADACLEPLKGHLR